jgi:hypothetical protein
MVRHLVAWIAQHVEPELLLALDRLVALLGLGRDGHQYGSETFDLRQHLL